MAVDHPASYTTLAGGNVVVSVASEKPMNFRSVSIGTASMEFYWVNSGKSSHWQFAPTLIDPTPAEHSIRIDDMQREIVDVQLGKKFFPATGLVKSNLIGEIRAPAVHFDLPHAYDLWVFILRSPWFPIGINIEKSPLVIAHNSAQAQAELQSVPSSVAGDQNLRVDVNLHGEGFKQVLVKLKRSTSRASEDTLLGELKSGMETFTWKPSIGNFNVVLSTYSNMDIYQFSDFLKFFGAEVQQQVFGFGRFMNQTFLLSDGIGLNYVLQLTGDTHILGHATDETNIRLSPQKEI